MTCTATDTFSSFWVGLDGDGTNSVEQTGTEADCNGGAAAYQGWFEMFPQAPVFYDNPVQPGDAMSASVVANGGGAFTLTLTDSTQGWTQATSQTSDTAQLGSAEVIAEAPSDGTGAVLPLSNFGTVSFTNATADNTAMGNENPAALTMVSASDVTEATPSALTGGNAFTVTWDSSGAPPRPRGIARHRPAPARAILRAGTTTVTGSTADRSLRRHRTERRDRDRAKEQGVVLGASPAQSLAMLTGKAKAGPPPRTVPGDQRAVPADGVDGHDRPVRGPSGRSPRCPVATEDAGERRRPGARPRSPTTTTRSPVAGAIRRSSVFPMTPSLETRMSPLASTATESGTASAGP